MGFLPLVDNKDFNDMASEMSTIVSQVIIYGSKEQVDNLVSILGRCMVFALNKYVSPEIVLNQVVEEMIKDLEFIKGTEASATVIKESKIATKH